MLRTLGIPSREVNGFLPGEYNDLAGDYIVRASDAHSWVEVYFPGDGWVTFDPTPAAAENFGFFSRLGQYVDWMELSWNEWVINYDFAHQVQMAQILQRNTRNWTESTRGWFAREQAGGKQWLRSWLDRRGAITFVLPVALMLLLGAAAVRLVARGDPAAAIVSAASRAGSESRESATCIAACMRSCCDLLERRGFRAARFADAAGVCGARWGNRVWRRRCGSSRSFMRKRGLAGRLRYLAIARAFGADSGGARIAI